MIGAGRDRGARSLAWEVLWRVHQDAAYPDLLLTSRFREIGSLAPVDRALANELVFGTLRWQLALDRALGQVSRRPIHRIHPKLLVLLRLSAYQILFLSRTPPSAAVNEAVHMGKALGFAHAAGFVNAVLRGVERRGSELLAVQPDLLLTERISQESSHPPWMVEIWIDQWGEGQTRALCAANNQVPPLILRTNTLKVSPQELARSLTEEGVVCEPTMFSPEGLCVTHLSGPLESLRSFQRGEFQIQDEASQLMARWLEPSPGDLILDACAAPGTKTTHLGQLTGDKARVVSVDIHEGRLQLVQEACARLGVTCVEIQQADLTDPKVLSADLYDRILLDAPCTGLGIVRRHPDIKWRRVPADIERMASLQRALLGALLPRLRPGGTLLYCVCTHTFKETQEILQAMLDAEPAYRLLKTASGLPTAARAIVGPDGLFRSFPHRHGMDGFTAFRLQRLPS